MDLDAFAGAIGSGKTRRYLSVGGDPQTLHLLKGGGKRRLTSVSYREMGHVLDESDFDAMFIDAGGKSDAVVSAIEHGARSPVTTIVVGKRNHEWNRLRSTLLGADAYCELSETGMKKDLWIARGGRDDLKSRFREEFKDFDDDELDEFMSTLTDFASRGQLSARTFDARVKQIVKEYVSKVPAHREHEKRVAERATRIIKGKVAASESPEPAELHWNTRFPDHPEVLAGSSHRVQPDTMYQLETALEPEAGDEDTAAVLADVLVGETVAFELRGFGAELVPKGRRKGRHRLTSEPLVCTEAGTEPFRCGVRFLAPPGESATVHMSLLVRGGTVASRDLSFAISETLPAKPRRKAPVETVPLAPDSVVEAEHVPLRLVLNEGHPAELYLGGNDPEFEAPSIAVDSQAWAVGTKIAQLSAMAEDVAPVGASATSFKLADSDEAIYQLAYIGAELHDALFLHGPARTRAHPRLVQLADAIRGLGSSAHPIVLHIEAAGYPVPWGLLYDRSKLDGDDLEKGHVDVDGFWGRRFDIQRTRFGTSRRMSRGRNPRMQPIVGPSVPSGDRQLDFITELTGMSIATVASPVTTSADLVAWAGSDAPTDLLYLFCHALTASWVDSRGGLQPPMDWKSSSFGFGADAGSDAVTIRQLRRAWGTKGARPTNPVVIANACASGSLDPENGTPFVDFFMNDWKAQAFIGTDWPVNGVFADRFGRLVLQRLLRRGDSLRAALRFASNKAFAQGNPFPLMYGIYGPTTVRFA